MEISQTHNSSQYAVEMKNVTKQFSGMIANDKVCLRVKEGEIHAILGENGAGKSTLMNLLFGLYKPDSGDIYIRGKKISIHNPNEATKCGIGMVHQHFHLVENFTVFENIILGVEQNSAFGMFEKKQSYANIQTMSDAVGMHVDLDARIDNIPVSMQQRVEILKILYRKSNILIFDEPTAVLTPQEIDDLLVIMKKLVKEGRSIIFITHKLKEILAIADTCTILRKGICINTVNVKNTNKEELAEMMIGHSVNFSIEKKPTLVQEVQLTLQEINFTNDKGIKKLQNCNLTLYAGEILGIAGIEGNGQHEISDIIVGLLTPTNGRILLNDTDITHMSIRNRIAHGLACIPEDRHKFGIIPHFMLQDNIILHDYYKKPFSQNGILQQDAIRKHANMLIENFDIRCSEGGMTNTTNMSGGNQQKAIIAREIYRNPKVLIAIQPTRGLDIGAIEYVHTRILTERDRGAAVLLISYDLDELLKITDTIAVLNKGQITKRIATIDTNEKQLGLAMTSSSPNSL